MEDEKCCARQARFRQTAEYSSRSRADPVLYQRARARASTRTS